MAAIMHRGRHSSRRSRGRHDSGDSDVPLDLSLDPEKNVTEILTNIVNTVGISRGRKLGHLNNFVKILRNVNEDTYLGFHLPELICCLRLSLFHDAKEVRAGGLRAFRYLLRNEESLNSMLKFHIDVLVARSLDIYQSNEIERVQALRFIRKIITLCPAIFPQSLAKAVIAIGNDGVHERDRLLRACMETICELALKNTELVSQCGGISTILHNILDNQQPRMNESLVFTILYLLNQPHTRKYIRSNVDLEKILAPYTDIHYRHTYHLPESHSQLSEDRESRWVASRMAIVSMFRSWPGMIRLCRPDASGLLSLLGVLCIPNEDIRKSIMDVFFDIFRLPIPVWTDDFNVALLSTDPSQMQLSWKLTAGFVCDEAKTILPHRAMTRSNLIENHLALLLQAFICAGLLESLVEVITTGDEHIAIRTTLMLGELLHMANTLLPYECGHHSHCLPTLMTLASSFDIPAIERVRASAAVSRLNRYHEMKKRGPVPNSLFLDQILKYTAKACETDSAKNNKVVKEKLIHSTYKDSDDPVSQAVKDTQVLATKANFEWDWDLITAVLKWPGSALRRLEDTINIRFVRRLIHFFKPSNNLFCSVDVARPDSRKYSVAGIQLVDFLLGCEEDGERLLIELFQEIFDNLKEVVEGAPTSSSLFNLTKVTTTLSQHYFLMLGKLTSSAQGEKVLEKTGLFLLLLDLCTKQPQEHLIKLVITSLDYSRNNLSRIILTKFLSSAPESMQLYATSYMRVLLRAKVPFFSSWGIELLVTQLYDKSRDVSMEAIDIIDEACEVEENLHALVQMRPSLLHMGDKGVLLLIRFLSIPKGFKCLADVNFVTHELDKWKKTFNLKYVTIVESELNEAFTTYQRPSHDVIFMRRSSEDQQIKKKDVFVPVHLYGQLAQHKAGAELLDKQDIVPELSRCIRYTETTPEKIMGLKAALWGLGHIGSSTWGLKLLAQEEIIPDIIRLAEECEVFSIRGTCFYVLGLIAKTRHGAEILGRLGWECIRHCREDIWPVVEERDVLLDETGNLLNYFPSMSSLQSSNSRTEGEAPQYYMPGEGQYGSFISLGERTIPDSSSPSSTFFVDINEKGDHVAPKGPDKSPAPVVIRASPKKERTGFCVDTEGRNRSSSNTRKLIASSRERELAREVELTPGRQRRRMTPSPEGKTVTVCDSPIFETKQRSNSDSRTMSNDLDRPGKLRSNRSFELKYNTLPKQRTQSFKYRSNSTESSGRGSMDAKSRSESFADTVTSGVSSLSSTTSSPPMDPANTESASSVSTSTINSSQTVKVIHASDFARKQVNLKRTPSFTRHFSANKSATLPSGAQFGSIGSVVESHATFTTIRDAQGLAALKNLKRQRADSLGEKIERIASSVPYTVSPGALGRSNTYSGRLASLGEGSQTSLESYDSLMKSRSLPRSQYTTPGGGDFVGLCLPVDVSMIFQVDDPPRRHSPVEFRRQGESLKMLSPVSEKSITSSIDQLAVPSASLTHFSLSNAAEDLHQQVRERKISRMESGFEVHRSEICLLCTKIRKEGIRVTVEDYSGGRKMDNDIGRLRVLSEGDDGAASDTGYEYTTDTPPKKSLLLKPLNTLKSPGSSEVTASSSVSSGESTPALRKLTEDSPLGRSLIKKEVLRLVVNLSSSVAMKAQEQGLLNLKERFPTAFQDVCLYSEVADLLGTYSFRLSARRFIQELFQDMTFAELYVDARAILQLAEIETASPHDNDF